MDFDVSRLRRRFSDGRRIEYFSSINSTNAEMLTRIKFQSAHQGDVIAATSQSEGRGRLGKSFASPDGGIYFTFAANNRSGDIATVTAGVAVADALSSYGVEPEIKWVNDVLIDNKKVCGILVQTVSPSDVCAVGIGINLKYGSVPDDLKDIATALDVFTDRAIPPEDLVADVINRYEELESDTAHTLERYKSYIRFFGRKITVKGSDAEYTAKDIAPHGELIVTDADGNDKVLNSGEISIRL